MSDKELYLEYVAFLRKNGMKPVPFERWRAPKNYKFEGAQMSKKKEEKKIETKPKNKENKLYTKEQVIEYISRAYAEGYRKGKEDAVSEAGSEDDFDELLKEAVKL